MGHIPLIGHSLDAFGENFLIAWGIIRTNRLRAALATLGILIGLTTILLMVTIIQGLNHALARSIESIGSTTLYVDKFPWAMEGNFFVYRNRPDLTMVHADAVRRQSLYVEYLAPTAGRGGDVKYRDRTARNVFLLGTNEEYEYTSNTAPETGRFLTEMDVSHRRYVCVLGREVVETLFERENPIGREIKIGGRSFEVVGVLERKGRIFDFSMDNRVIIPIGAFFKTFGSRRSLTIEARVADASLMGAARDEMTGILRRARRLRPGEDDNFAVNHQEAILNMYHRMTAGVYAAGIGIASIALLVGGIGIMNIMLVSVAERTREIGVRKALGARRSMILQQFLIEAVLICSGGGLLGVGLAAGVSRIIEAATPLPTTMPIWVVILGLAFSSTVGIVFGLVPAARAARLDPVEALRYE